MISKIVKYLESTWKKIEEHAENMTIKGKEKRQYGLLKHAQRATTPVPPRSKKFIVLGILAFQIRHIHWELRATFDMDSFKIGIDNRCCACISCKIDNFVGELKDCNRTIKGFMGTRTSNVKIETLQWKWLDNTGKEHKFLIPNSYYVPQENMCLLSPQHWAQEMKDFRPVEGTGEYTNANHCKLY